MKRFVSKQQNKRMYAMNYGIGIALAIFAFYLQSTMLWALAGLILALGLARQFYLQKRLK